MAPSLYSSASIADAISLEEKKAVKSKTTIGSMLNCTRHTWVEVGPRSMLLIMSIVKFFIDRKPVTSILAELSKTITTSCDVTHEPEMRQAY